MTVSGLNTGNKSKSQITVRNKLFRDPRNIDIYHHSTRGAHIISRGHSVKIALLDKDRGDYLHIGMNRADGNPGGGCRITVPIWLDLEFSAPGDLILKHMQEDGRIYTRLILPPGSPSWEITVTWPGHPSGKDRDSSITIDNGDR